MKKGFTLVELLLYMALLGVFLVVLTNALVASLQSQLESASTSLVDIDSRFILSRLAYDVSHAASISLPVGEGQTATSLELSSGTYSVVNNNLILNGNQLNSYDSSVSGFSVTRVGNGANKKDTVIIDFTVTSADLSRSYETTLGLR